MTRPHFDPGPPPPAGGVHDGLRDAFRRAHRRRARTALASSLPVLLGAFALASLPAGGGAVSLDTTPAGVPTGGAGTRDGGSVVAGPRPDARAQGAAGGGGVAAPGRAPARPGAAARPGDTPASPLPPLPTDLPPRGGHPESEYLELSAANGTASTRIELPGTLHVEHPVDLRSDGRYAGVYFVSDDGATAGGMFAQPTGHPDLDAVGRHHPPPHHSIGNAATLPAGGYTVYVVGEGSITVRLMLRHGEPGLRATATTPATAYFDEETTRFATGASSAELRLPVTGDATAVGIGGGYLRSDGGKTSTEFTACLTARSAACTADDPSSGGGADISVGGTEGGAIEIANGALATERDLLGRGEVAAATDAEIYAFYVVLDLP